MKRSTARLVAGVAATLLLAADARAQQPTPVPPPVPGQASRAWEIVDNSFLVEEAFNQDRGVVQNIASFVRIGSGWAFGFTQEWPIGSVRHQFSYSVPALNGDTSSGLGDVMLNYRFQVMEEGHGRPAFAPRATIILPTGDPNRGTGDGVYGWQFNLPFSKQLGNFYAHWNAGVTILPREAAASGVKATLTSPSLAGSIIWRARPMINVLIENAWLWAEQLDEAGVTSRMASYTLSPGVRGGWNIGDAQLVIGAAVPVVWTSDRAEVGGFLYFSYELPFRR
jgi:hypothetical protein